MVIIWLFVGYVAFVGLGMSTTLVSSIWPTVAHEIGTLETNIAIYMGAYLICDIIFLTFASTLIARYGARNSFGLGVILAGMGVVILSFAKSMSGFVIAGIFLGSGGGIIDTAVNYYLALYYKPILLTWAHCLWGVGSTLGPIIMIKLLSGGNSYNGCYLAIAPFYIIFGLLIFILRLIDDRLRNVKIKKQNVVEKKNVKVDYKKIFTTKNAIIFFLCMFFIDFLVNSTSVWLTTYLNVLHGIDINVAAKMLSLYFVGLTIFRFLSGIAVEKFGFKKVMIFGFLMCIIASIIMIIVKGNMTFIPIGVFCMGIGVAPLYPLCIAYAKEVFESSELSGAIGLAGSTAQIGSCTASFSIGFLANIFNLNAFTYSILIVGVISLFTFLKLVKNK